MLDALRELYDGQTERARRFQAALFVFDAVTLLFIIGTSFVERQPFLDTVDAIIGVLIALDLVARIAASRERAREILRPSTWADAAAVVSLLAPISGEAAAFLRVLRTLRLLRSYAAMARGGEAAGVINRNEETIIAVANLLVFVFIMTAIVYETQHRTNPDIGHYADALYFTVTALTTTGFGDITLPGTTGRMISVAIMIFGVTLFLRLAQVLFRPAKVHFPCPTCGLQRHDFDAVHCKACGTLLNIPNDES